MVPSLRLLICKMGMITAPTHRGLWSRPRPPASCREELGERGEWLVGGGIISAQRGTGSAVPEDSKVRGKLVN